MDLLTLNDLLEVLRVLNASPSLTELHDELIQWVLKKIKKELGVETETITQGKPEDA